MTKKLPYIIGDSKDIRGHSKAPISAIRMRALLTQQTASRGRARLLAGAVLLLTLIWVYTSRSERLLGSAVYNLRGDRSRLPVIDQSGHLQIPSILDVAEGRLDSVAKDFDYVRYNSEFGLNFRHRSLDDYRKHALATLVDMFEVAGLAPTPEDDMRQKDVLTQLTVGGPDRLSWNLDDAMPRKLFTTSQYLDGDQWDQFPLWTSLNPDWTLTHVDDAGIVSWLNATFSRLDESGHLRQANIVERVDKLHRGVLKADMYRYLVMFLEGGVYSDTDTAPCAPMSDWPGLWKPDDIPEVYDPVVKSAEMALVTAGTRVEQRVVPLHARGKKGISSNDREAIVHVGTSKTAMAAQQRPPRLILGWEGETWVQDQWRGWMARGLQMVQWTIAARPSHPVFLTILESAFAMEAEYQAGKIPEPKVLDLTGPGQLADALFEHLLLRYGILPEQITGLGEHDAVRAGDVLIYNSRSFQVPITDVRKGGKLQLVSHAYFSRWKQGRMEGQPPPLT